MALRLQIISEQRRLLGEHATVVFGVRGGRIGRAADNDWVLPDPRRYLSAHHAQVHGAGEQFAIEDTSTNGVYINDSDIPVGRNNRVVLQDGDLLRLGDYRFRVHIDPIEVRDSLSDELVAVDTVEPLRRAGEAVPRPVAAERAPEPDPGEAMDLSERSPRSLLAEANPHSGDLAETGIEGSSRLSAIFDVRAGLHAFCRGAGIEVGQLRPDSDLRVLLLAGQLLRESLLGLQELVHAQRECQQRLGTDVPVSAVAGPAPDASSPADYLLKLFNGQEDDALDAVQTLRAWFAAGRRHESALPHALPLALDALLRQLDPEAIEGRARARGSPEHAWPLFVELYKSLRQTARGDLPRAYAEALVQAYAKSLG